MEKSSIISTSIKLNSWILKIINLEDDLIIAEGLSALRIKLDHKVDKKKLKEKIILGKHSGDLTKIFNYLKISLSKKNKIYFFKNIPN